LKKYKIAVLGAGNAGVTFAGDLTLAGHCVNLCDLPHFEERLVPIRESKGEIEMAGACRNGFAKLNLYTTDVAQALKGVEVIMIASPAFRHQAFAEAISPHLQDGQIIVLNPGYSFGAVEVATILKKNGVNLNSVLIGSTVAMVYGTRKYCGSKVYANAVKAKVPFAAFPAKNEIFPQEDGKRGVLIPTTNELKTTLENINPPAHVPMMLLKAVYVELGEEPYDKCDKSHAVKCMMKAINQETLAITEAFGLEPLGYEFIHDVLMYPYWLRLPRSTERPAWAVPENMPWEYTTKANLLNMRYLHEDVPYGLVAISELGEMVNVPTPVIDSAITLASIITETDFKAKGRTLEKLGLNGMSNEELLCFLNHG
jgi:opine dehydrogenase